MLLGCSMTGIDKGAEALANIEIPATYYKADIPTNDLNKFTIRKHNYDKQ